jgi:hypothetical protein
MKKQTKAKSRIPIVHSNTNKNGNQNRKESVLRLFLYIVCGYILLVFLTWLFCNCPEAIKITICLIAGLIINLIFLSIDIKEIKIKGIVIVVKVIQRFLFSIIVGLLSVFAVYVFAFSYQLVKDCFHPLKCKCECNCVEIPLKLIPSGKYNIGISANEEKRIIDMFPGMASFLIDEKPQHTVVLDSFYMSVYEITDEIYKCFAKENGISFSYKKTDKFKPINNISWDEAKQFCTWLSVKIGVNIDLPTEAQWEVAAGAYIYPWGDDFPRASNVIFNSANGVAPVDSIKNYSLFGIVNMAGNVAEWCLDWYDNYSNYIGNRNPQGPRIGTRKVVRGGSWKDNAFDVRVSKRGSYPPTTKGNNIGFRIVINNHLINGGNNYGNQNIQISGFRNAVIIINGM